MTCNQLSLLHAALLRFLNSMALASSILLSCTSTAQTRPPSPAVADCDRGCLTGIADSYLKALVTHDPKQVAWADTVKFTENNVPLAIGDGIWGTITRSEEHTSELQSH